MRPPHFILPLALLTPLAALSTATAFEDFSQPGLGDRWTAVGELTATLQAGDDDNHVRLDGAAGAMFVTRPDAPTPNYLASSLVTIRCRAPNASPDAPVTFELQFHSSSRRGARLWRKVDLDTPGWQDIELTLAYFRHSGSFALQWQEVGRLGIFLRHEAILDVAHITFSSPQGTGPHLSPALLKDLAFPEAATASAKPAGPFSVITEAPIDHEELAAELIRLQQLVSAHFPAVLDPPPSPIPLIVFASEQDYQDFWPRFAKAFNSQIDPPRAAGFAALGVAATWHDPDQGSVRPVMLHEACHALLEPVLGLSNVGEWLHEGIANYFQLHWSRQDLTAIIAPRIRNGQLLPLAELCDGQGIAMEHYAQAALLIQFFLSDPARSTQLMEAIKLMSNTGSSALAPVAKETFGKPLDKLQMDWLEWAATLTAP
jgi:hypothetical protein